MAIYSTISMRRMVSTHVTLSTQHLDTIGARLDSFTGLLLAPPPNPPGNGNGNGNVQINSQQVASTQALAQPVTVELTRSEEIQALPTMAQVSGLVPAR